MTSQDKEFFIFLINRPIVGWIFMVCRICTCFIFLGLLIVLNLMFVCRHNGSNRPRGDKHDETTAQAGG